MKESLWFKLDKNHITLNLNLRFILQVNNNTLSSILTTYNIRRESNLMKFAYFQVSTQTKASEKRIEDNFRQILKLHIFYKLSIQTCTQSLSSTQHHTEHSPDQKNSI